jgi:arginase family enzyme
MEFTEYLSPVDFNSLITKGRLRSRLGHLIDVYALDRPFPSLENVKVAILGVPESRGTNSNKGAAKSPNAVRAYLYDLFPHNRKLNVVDVGDVKLGATISDTYHAVGSLVSELLSLGIIPLIIGGSQDLTYGTYLGYERLGQTMTLASIDRIFDLGESEHEIDSNSWLSRLIIRQPNYLFNYTNIGYQTYLVDQEAVKLMKQMFFDVYRLGQFSVNIEEAEPLIRNADSLSVDISAVRASDAPGCADSTPNGFYGEQMCQLMWYAGISDKVSSIGFYEVNPDFDPRGQTAHLTAQMIWYFIDGALNRLNEMPTINQPDETHLRYFVKIEGQDEEIVFYKSTKTDRWWMQVACPPDLQTKYSRHVVVPCSYNDYKTASENDLPDRWWQVYQKIM